MKFRLSRHAREEIERRDIPLELLTSVLENPEQIIPERYGKQAYQSRVDFGGQVFLLRAIVAKDTDPPVVVTAYRTKKIDKYWRS